MIVFHEQQNKDMEVKFEGKMFDLLEKLGVNSEEVLTVKNDELVTLDEELKNSDVVKLLSVISGG